MYLTKPAAIGIQILGAIFLIVGLSLIFYVDMSIAAIVLAILGASLIALGHPKANSADNS